MVDCQALEKNCTCQKINITLKMGLIQVNTTGTQRHEVNKTWISSEFIFHLLFS